MSRIRTVKPEFWASEQIMELSIQARLCFIGLWTFADDNGVHPASPKTLKAEVFPADDLTADVVSGLIAEMVSHGLVGEFEADGKRYWFVTGWHRHQRIDRPTFKHPAPPTGKLDEQSTNTRRVIDEQSTSNRPRKGKEGIGKETTYSDTAASLVAIAGDQNEAEKVGKQKRTPCPHQEIIALYHEALPTCPQIRDWTAARSALLRARWNEDPRRQNLDFWRRFFGYVAESDFLTGRVSTPGRRTFSASLEWLLKPENFAKVREGRYHGEAAA